MTCLVYAAIVFVMGVIWWATGGTCSPNFGIGRDRISDVPPPNIFITQLPPPCYLSMCAIYKNVDLFLEVRL